MQTMPSNSLMLRPSVVDGPPASLVTQLQSLGLSFPAAIHAAGEDACRAFLDYFTATIRNKNTRAAYGRAIGRFFDWLGENGVADVRRIETFHVAAYIEGFTATHSAPTTKQGLAAIRMLFDFLTVRQVIKSNPAHVVKGPRYSISTGKTSVLTAEEARQLIDAIDISTLGGLRDRALIAVMLFSFARISAVLNMRVEDYFPKGKRYWLRLHEKGGKEHSLPCHHLTEEYLDAYLDAAGIRDQTKAPLFRTTNPVQSQLSDRRLDRHNAYLMVRKYAIKAGLKEKVGCHSWRATGITVFLSNKGSLETAQKIAAHSSPRTTKLYDRTSDVVSLNEIERIRV
jgi:integrase/recombinase XerD